MTAHARNTHPETSHEAAASITTRPSHVAVMTAARNHLTGPFTDKDLIRTFRQEWATLPWFSESRIRTARRELVDRGLLQLHGLTRPVSGRRERLWEVTA